MLFTRKTVASVMSGFQKVADDLRKVAQAQDQKAVKAGEKIEKLLDKVEAKELEMDKAKAESQAAHLLADKITAQFLLD